MIWAGSTNSTLLCLRTFFRPFTAWLESIEAVYMKLGALAQLASIFILAYRMHRLGSCKGISLKSEILGLVVFLARYPDLFIHYISFFNTGMKILYILSSCYVLFLICYRYRATYDSALDTFPVTYLIVPSILLGLVLNYRSGFLDIGVVSFKNIFYQIKHYHFDLLETLWAFSYFLAVVAILPQRMMLHSKSFDDEHVISPSYLVALVLYRVLYLIHWYQKYYSTWIETVTVTTGIMQTIIYLEFCYAYYRNVYCRKQRPELPEYVESNPENQKV